MKTLMIKLAALCGSAVALAGCASTPVSGSAMCECVDCDADSACCTDGTRAEAGTCTPPASVRGEAGEAVLQVGGMSCPMCASNAKLELGDLKGVKDVRVDLSRAEVHVAYEYGQRPSDAELSRAINDAGFTLKGIDGR